MRREYPPIEVIFEIRKRSSQAFMSKNFELLQRIYQLGGGYLLKKRSIPRSFLVCCQRAIFGARARPFLRDTGHVDSGISAIDGYRTGLQFLL
jgi:hypothetical protein